jgi:hypothetical protein
LIRNSVRSSDRLFATGSPAPNRLGGAPRITRFASILLIRAGTCATALDQVADQIRGSFSGIARSCLLGEQLIEIEFSGRQSHLHLLRNEMVDLDRNTGAACLRHEVGASHAGDPTINALAS